MKDKLNNFYQGITLIIGILTIIIMLQTNSKDLEVISIIIFGIITTIIILAFTINSIYSKYKEITRNINHNQKQIQELKKDLNLKELIQKLEIRMAIFENIKNKKGEIDPRIIIVIVLIVLFYLFLKSTGII